MLEERIQNPAWWNEDRSYRTGVTRVEVPRGNYHRGVPRWAMNAVCAKLDHGPSCLSSVVNQPVRPNRRGYQPFLKKFSPNLWEGGFWARAFGDNQDQPPDLPTLTKAGQTAYCSPGSNPLSPRYEAGALSTRPHGVLDRLVWLKRKIWRKVFVRIDAATFRYCMICPRSLSVSVKAGMEMTARDRLRHVFFFF